MLIGALIHRSNVNDKNEACLYSTDATVICAWECKGLKLAVLSLLSITVMLHDAAGWLYMEEAHDSLHPPLLLGYDKYTYMSI